MIFFKKKKIWYCPQGPFFNNIIWGSTAFFQGILFSSKNIVCLDVDLLILYFSLPLLISLLALIIVRVFLKISHYFTLLNWLILLSQTFIILSINSKSLVPTIIFILFCHVLLRLVVYGALFSSDLRGKISHRENHNKENDRK